MKLSANTPSELLKKIGKIDITVPPRSEGRTTEHSETYSICYLLSTLAETDFIQWPLIIQKRERPDFYLKVGNTEVGIEITESVPQNEAAKEALRDSGNGPDVYFISSVSPGEKKKNHKKLKKEICSNLPGDGWWGDQPEKEWAEAMLSTINKKTEKYLNPTYKKYSNNWLLIYDNWPLPHFDHKLSSQKLIKLLEHNSVFKLWDNIFIHSRKKIHIFSASLINSYETLNIWKY